MHTVPKLFRKRSQPATGKLHAAAAFGGTGEDAAVSCALSRALVPALILAGGLWVGLKPSYGKPEYTRKEQKDCIFCHVSKKSFELNEAGKYYRDHKGSLKGYQSPPPPKQT